MKIKNKDVTMLVFDFETYDKDLSTRGCGYIWGNIQIIGMGYKIDNEDTKYTTDTGEMKQILEENKTWVAHNIVYELSIAKYLGVDFKDKNIYCTKVGSYLDKNTRMRHSLDYLGKTLLNKEKDQERFGRLVLDKKLCIKADGSAFDYPKKYYTTDDEEYKAKTRIKYTRSATSLAMKNLHIINIEAPDLIEEYCKSDVDLTYELHELFSSKIEDNLYSKFSEVNKVIVEMRHKGVKIDLDKAQEVREYLNNKIDTLNSQIEDLIGEVNFRSNKQLAEVFDKLGISYPTTEKGNPQIKSEWLEIQSHEVCKLIVQVKKYIKTRDDFIDKLVSHSYKGRIHGEMKLFGAAQTGRFSHSNPNLAQIPSRDPEIGPMIRSIFIADEGEKWYSLDFSAQEPRMMVHYGVMCHKAGVSFKREVFNRQSKSWEWSKKLEKFNVPSVMVLRQAYIDDPALDSHTFNMNIINDTTGVGIDRKSTKTIALGKAYALGLTKLADQLNISDDLARELADAFDKGSPYLKELDAYCKYRMNKEGKIKTIGGRYTYSDGITYKALNKLIQGSAADQTAFAMLMMYKEYDIVPQVVVHDSVDFSGTKAQARKVKYCMENAVNLLIPSMSEIVEGNNWGECKE